MKKHTPGPWQSYSDGSKAFVRNEHSFVASMSADTDRCDADARLIAAAPEMLAALEAVYEHLAKVKAPGELHIQIADAINKAKG